MLPGMLTKISKQTFDSVMPNMWSGSNDGPIDYIIIHNQNWCHTSWLVFTFILYLTLKLISWKLLTRDVIDFDLIDFEVTIPSHQLATPMPAI